MAQTTNTTAWEVSDIDRLKRFLCLGSDSGTYNVDADQLGKENTACIKKLLDDGKGKEVVETIVSFSAAGRVAKQDTVIFALAVCATLSQDSAVKQLAHQALPQVCRIPTHLFSYVSLAETFSSASKATEQGGGDKKNTGWGRGRKKAVSEWYNKKDRKTLALHVTKYKQRKGWSHKDVLRLAHVKPDDEVVGLIFTYAVKGYKAADEKYGKLKEAGGNVSAETHEIMSYLSAVDRVKHTEDEQVAARLIEEHRLVWEHVPTPLLNKKEVWRALVKSMPMQALIRNLGRLTSMELLNPLDDNSEAKTVIERLKDPEQIRNAKIHPFPIMVAMETYRRGSGHTSDREKKTKWMASPPIYDALTDAFSKSFQSIKSTGKRFLLALDHSGFMQNQTVTGSPHITTLAASAAMVMAVVRTEDKCKVVAILGDKTEELDIRRDTPFDEVQRKLPKVNLELPNNSKLGHMGSALASPIQEALVKKEEYDVFIIYTDNENMRGKDPSEVFDEYRSKINKDAKMVVCALTSTRLSVGRQDDKAILNVAGFDSHAPLIIHQFVGGAFYADSL